MAKSIFSLCISLCLSVGLCFGYSIKSTPLRDSLAVVYKSQIGVRELTGRNDGPQVNQYQKATGNTTGEAWCASFVAWCLKKIGIRYRANGAARSWFMDPVYVRNTNGVRKFSSLAAKRGNLGSIYYSNLNRIGHVFFIDDVRGEYVITVEGNTNNGQSRNGDGVYSLRRRIRNIYSVSNPFKNYE